jgi:hypothetical protein
MSQDYITHYQLQINYAPINLLMGPTHKVNLHPIVLQIARIRCELSLDSFGFSSHDAPWCPFLHPEDIRDRDIKQRVLQ